MLNWYGMDILVLLLIKEESTQSFTIKCVVNFSYMPLLSWGNSLLFLLCWVFLSRMDDFYVIHFFYLNWDVHKVFLFYFVSVVILVSKINGWYHIIWIYHCFWSIYQLMDIGIISRLWLLEKCWHLDSLYTFVFGGLDS